MYLINFVSDSNVFGIMLALGNSRVSVMLLIKVTNHRICVLLDLV
jgi:hypothetical protein